MTRFLSTETVRDPRSRKTPSDGEMAEVSGDSPDFAMILWKARRTSTCAECGCDITYVSSPRSGFCCETHYYAFRDRRRYWSDPEGQRERARAYYWANREKVLEKAAAKRGKTRSPEQTECSECGELLSGRQRVICGKASCRDRRFRRLHPEAYAERERQKVERRRERRRAARSEAA